MISGERHGGEGIRPWFIVNHAYENFFLTEGPFNNHCRLTSNFNEKNGDATYCRMPRDDIMRDAAGAEYKLVLFPSFRSRGWEM